MVGKLLIVSCKEQWSSLENETDGGVTSVYFAYMVTKTTS